VRAKVEAFLLDEAEVPATRKRRAQTAARRYFDLASRYAGSLPPAMLVVTCGLAGSGKSTLARALSQEKSFEVISSDIVRKRIAGLAPEEPRRESFEAGIYAPDATEKTYDALFEEARERLDAGRSVILDATFLRRKYRRCAARLARETGAQFACLVLRTSEKESRRRLDRRAGLGAGVSDARWETYKAQKRRFQQPSEVREDRRIEIDAERPIRSQVRSALDALREISPLSVSK
jgi:predicted kinase